MHSESFPILDEQQQQQYATGEEQRTGIENVIDIRIFYPNGTNAVQFSVENGAEATGSDLLRLMADHLEIDDVQVAEESLAIWVVSPLLELQMKPRHIPYVVYMKWPAFLRRFTTAEEDEIALDEPLLVLRRNVLFTLDREILFTERYERLTEVLYLHARDEYLSGRYLVNIETALELVGLQMAIEFGTYNGDLEDALDLLYDNLRELAPEPHIKAIRSFHLFGLRVFECKGGLEHRVVEEYQSASHHYPGDKDAQRRAFLSILRREPFYGAAFYSGTIDSSHVRPRVNGTHHNPLHNRGTQSSDVENQSDHSAGSSSPCSSTKSNKSTLSLGSFFSFLRNHFLHHHHHHQQRGNGGGKHNGSGTGSRHRQDDILIGINHTHITLIDPRQHKVLDVFGDRSPEGNMSLNEKIALFCNAD
uniref:FERM domain-containing protein 8 n=1 Tax=Globodera pallida TaxID=36090 RepID=A0A183BJL3_GLOPA